LKTVLSDKDILVDATHMFLKHRRQSLNIIKGMEGEYEKIVVRFTFDGIKSKLIKSANRRKLETGKSIQQELFDKMYNNFTEPTLAEGFDKIIIIDPVWLDI
jgi:tRNA uridine 5-carbamoylmethylation protein Kti12